MTDLSIINLIKEASPLVQLVMLTLLMASIASWAIIFSRLSALRSAKKAADEFEARFWASADYSSIQEDIAKHEGDLKGMEAIFAAGEKELDVLRQHGNMDSGEVFKGTQRAMRVALRREIDRLEGSLVFLATVGSTSPYIGLFGTVWGIMNSFRSLANVSQATLSMVAPGISEALIATAMGLFAAIPAVIAYNKFNDDVEKIINRYGTFMDEFTSVLQRKLMQ